MTEVLEKGEPEVLVCEVCGDEEAVGVAAIPGVPASAAYGRKCLEANAHPMWALVGNTAAIYPGGGDTLDRATAEWQHMVYCTLEHLGKDRGEFDELVKEAYGAMEEAMQPTAESDLLYEAWGIIANARDWNLDDEKAKEWKKAATGWRDQYHFYLAREDFGHIEEAEVEDSSEEE